MEYHEASAQRRATNWYLFFFFFSLSFLFFFLLCLLYFRYRQDRGVAGGECKATLHIPDVNCMAKVGNFIACGMKDGTLTIINPQARKQLRRVQIHEKQITSIMWLVKEERYYFKNIHFVYIY